MSPFLQLRLRFETAWDKSITGLFPYKAFKSITQLLAHLDGIVVNVWNDCVGGKSMEKSSNRHNSCILFGCLTHIHYFCK